MPWAEAGVPHLAGPRERVVQRLEILHRLAVVELPGAPGVTACQRNPWLGGDNRSERWNRRGGVAWHSGLAASLALCPEQVRRSDLRTLSVVFAGFESRTLAWSLVAKPGEGRGGVHPEQHG